jgi:hypothetical protein
VDAEIAIADGLNPPFDSDAEGRDLRCVVGHAIMLHCESSA